MTRSRRIARFSGAERTLHWLLAMTFFPMLGSGLALFVPDLATFVARPTAKAWHINSAVVLAAGVLAPFRRPLVAPAGDHARDGPLRQRRRPLAVRMVALSPT